MSGKPITPEEKEEILKMFQADLRITDIALRTGRTKPSISMIIKGFREQGLLPALLVAIKPKEPITHFTPADLSQLPDNILFKHIPHAIP